jgi:transposase
MILLPRAVRIYMASAPCSLRKSFEGLSNEVRSVLGRDPLSGHLFIFVNRRASQVKILVWTRGGYMILHKRLERGRFTFPAKPMSADGSMELDAHELSMLLEGLTVSRTTAARRWSPPLPPRLDARD